MVHTAQLLCLNVKIMFVSIHLGNVMVIMTVVMVPMKNSICAVSERLRGGGVNVPSRELSRKAKESELIRSCVQYTKIVQMSSHLCST